MDLESHGGFGSCLHLANATGRDPAEFAERVPCLRGPHPPRIEAMPFPATRMRRMRRTKALRSLIRETALAPSQLIQPAFVVAGEGVREEIEAMPGVERFSISELVAEATEIATLGVGALLLF